MMSNGSQIPPKLSTCLTSSGFFEGLREVAITLWPFLSAMRERAVPKPEEQPVMSQTRGLVFEDILGFGIENIGMNLSCFLIKLLQGGSLGVYILERGRRRVKRMVGNRGQNPTPLVGLNATSTNQQW